jgi:hypothetical protein
MTRPRRRIWPLTVIVVAVAFPAPADPTTAPSGEPERRLVNDRCPVMDDEPASPLHEVQFRGVAVRFCCSDCADTFAESPAPYLSRLPQLPVAAMQGSVSDSEQHARAERTAGRIDRWARPVLLLLACLIAVLLVLRVVRRTRGSRAMISAFHSSKAGDGLHPATAPRGPD